MTRPLEEDARSDAVLSSNYIVLTLASSVIATLGLIENSVAVIIGAMIVAPLIGPIQAFAFAALTGDARLVRQALTSAVAGAVIAIATSAGLGFLIALPTYGSEVLGRTRPTVLDLGIAIAAGGVAGFAKIRPSISSTIAGTAIAVALMPPLCVIGLALAAGQWGWAKGAALLFGTNFLGIALACMVVYIIARRGRARSRIGLITTIVVTAALTVPLGISFFELTRESRLEADIRHELVSNTVTFKRVRLIGASFDWYSTPVSAQLAVSAAQAVTPSQVGDLEAFITRKTGQNVRLSIQVSRYETVTDTPAPSGIASPADASARATSIEHLHRHAVPTDHSAVDTGRAGRSLRRRRPHVGAGVVRGSRIRRVARLRRAGFDHGGACENPGGRAPRCRGCGVRVDLACEATLRVRPRTLFRIPASSDL
jgi:uncharacterized hydrophobic protein (TIGR00271 family)